MDLFNELMTKFSQNIGHAKFDRSIVLEK